MKKAIRLTLGTLLLSAAVLSAALVGSGGDPIPECPPGLCLNK